MSKADEETNPVLFDARNEYYVGNYMGSINCVLPQQGAAPAELRAYMYLSYLAMDSGRLVATDIKESDTTPLLALRYVHEAREQPERTKDLLDKLLEKVAIEEDESNIWHLAAAILSYQDGQYDNALNLVHSSRNLESLAMAVQCLLRLNRADIAKQFVAKMQEISDDATLTQLAHAWLTIAQGTEKMQDAYYVYQEFCEKFTPTPLLLNGQAVVHLGLERYEEAESALREALLKKHNDYDALVNTMVLTHLKGNTTAGVARYLEQLRQFHPNSELIAEFDNKSNEFDALAMKYTVNNGE